MNSVNENNKRVLEISTLIVGSSVKMLLKRKSMQDAIGSPGDFSPKILEKIDEYIISVTEMRSAIASALEFIANKK